MNSTSILRLSKYFDGHLVNKMAALTCCYLEQPPLYARDITYAVIGTKTKHETTFHCHLARVKAVFSRKEKKIRENVTNSQTHFCTESWL